MSILIEMVEQAQTVAILGHVRPDGDCIGSSLGLLNYLQEQYPHKTVQLYLEKPAKKFSYLKCFDSISQEVDQERVYDLCICLDSGDVDRLGPFGVYLEHAKKSICLDHHITNSGYAEINIVEAHVSSTCEVLYSFLDDDKISLATAECLYTGIIHDTNVFKNGNTTVKTMEVAGRMMEKGINFGRIINDSFYHKTYIQNQILGRALLESMTILQGACIFSAIRQKDMDFYGVESSDLDGIVDQLRVTDGVECAIFMHEIENHVYKISMRSNYYVDVSAIAAYFGGGGHVRAAGCIITGSLYDVINNLSSHIEKQIKEHH